MLQLFFGGLTAANGITLLCALYIGAVSGGLISAILLNMPGDAATAMLLGSFMVHGRCCLPLTPIWSIRFSALCLSRRW